MENLTAEHYSTGTGSPVTELKI